MVAFNARMILYIDSFGTMLVVFIEQLRRWSVLRVSTLVNVVCWYSKRVGNFRHLMWKGGGAWSILSLFRTLLGLCTHVMSVAREWKSTLSHPGDEWCKSPTSVFGRTIEGLAENVLFLVEFFDIFQTFVGMPTTAFVIVAMVWEGGCQYWLVFVLRVTWIRSFRLLS